MFLRGQSLPLLFLCPYSFSALSMTCLTDIKLYADDVLFYTTIHSQVKVKVITHYCITEVLSEAFLIEDVQVVK